MTWSGGDESEHASGRRPGRRARTRRRSTARRRRTRGRASRRRAAPAGVPSTRPKPGREHRHRDRRAAGEEHERRESDRAARDRCEQQHADTAAAADAVHEADPEGLPGRARSAAPADACASGRRPLAASAGAATPRAPTITSPIVTSAPCSTGAGRYASQSTIGTPKTTSDDAWPRPHASPRRVAPPRSFATSVVTAARWSGSLACRRPSSTATPSTITSVVPSEKCMSHWSRPNIGSVRLEARGRHYLGVSTDQTASPSRMRSATDAISSVAPVTSLSSSSAVGPWPSDQSSRSRSPASRLANQSFPSSLRRNSRSCASKAQERR